MITLISHRRFIRAGLVLITVAVFGMATLLSIPLAEARPSTLPTPKPDIRRPVAMSSAGIAVATMLPVRKAAVVRSASLAQRSFDRFNKQARLSDEDAARYAHIFAFQENGELKKADAEIAKLTDHRLMGHVLYQRYVGKHYTTSYRELVEWLKQYRDHPGAERLYKLAQRKKRGSRKMYLRKPKPGRAIPSYQDADVGPLGRSYLSTRRFRGTSRDVVRYINRKLSSHPTGAITKLESPEVKKIFRSTTYDALQAKIAQSYFYNGKADKAFEYAKKSAVRSGKDVPVAGWIAGLSAWKMGQYDIAAPYFEQAATSKRASAWLVSAAAHWAARSHLRAKNPRAVSQWLKVSAQYPRTFYGLISAEMLGARRAKFNWKQPRLNDARVRVLAAVPAGRRALALVDAGQADLAGQELRYLHPGNNFALQESVLALTLEAGIPDLALRMGSTFEDKKEQLYDAALYPDTPWQIDDDFKVDRALVNAFIRQESKFNITAKNRSSGARGLMQMMPRTAKGMAQRQGMKINTSDLNDPGINVRLGRAYLQHLLEDDRVAGNLLKLAVAYNAGPGTLSRWERKISYEDDPLLFIESIPAGETRMFVERVMTNYWIYREKYDQSTPSLDKLAEGYWPMYTALDRGNRSRFADAGMVFRR